MVSLFDFAKQVTKVFPYCFLTSYRTLPFILLYIAQETRYKRGEVFKHPPPRGLARSARIGKPPPLDYGHIVPTLILRFPLVSLATCIIKVLYRKTKITCSSFLNGIGFISTLDFTAFSRRCTYMYSLLYLAV